MELKVFAVYLEDEDGPFKVMSVAGSEQEVMKNRDAYGELIAVREVKAAISLYKVQEALKNAGFSRADIEVVTGLLDYAGFAIK